VFRKTINTPPQNRMNTEHRMTSTQEELVALQYELAALKAEVAELKKEKAETWFRLTKDDVASVYADTHDEAMPEKVYKKFLRSKPSDKYNDIYDYTEGIQQILDDCE